MLEVGGCQFVRHVTQQSQTQLFSSQSPLWEWDGWLSGPATPQRMHRSGASRNAAFCSLPRRREQEAASRDEHTCNQTSQSGQASDSPLHPAPVVQQAITVAN